MATLATFYFLTVGALPDASSPQTSTGGLVTLAPLMAVVASALVAWLAAQLQRTRSALAAAESALAVAAKVNVARDKHLAQEVESSRELLHQAKVDLAAQRKKNHDQAQALRAAEQLAREETQRRVAAQNARPAFAEVKVVPKDTAKAAPPPPAKVGTAVPHAADAAAAVPAADAATITALQAEIDGLKARYAEAQTRLTTASEAAATHKQTAQRLQRKTEDLRRIDLIGRSKLELLEDKLRALGRQHYEAISELAALKGEVAPPQARRAAGRSRRAAATEMADSRRWAARGAATGGAPSPDAGADAGRLDALSPASATPH